MFFTPKSPSSFVLVHKYKVGVGGGQGAGKAVNPEEQEL